MATKKRPDDEPSVYLNGQDGLSVQGQQADDDWYDESLVVPSEDWVDEGDGIVHYDPHSVTTPSKEDVLKNPVNYKWPRSDEGQKSGYDITDDLYNARFGLTKEEQKRRRRDEMISSIGDAVSALGNMYFTGKGGVNAYDPTKSMTEATRKRYDRLLQERRQEFNDYLAAERVRELNDYRKRRLDLDAQKLAETARVNDSKIEANKALYKQRVAAGAAQDELALIRHYQALLEKNKAEGYPEYLRAQIADYESRVLRNVASAGASAARQEKDRKQAGLVGQPKTVTKTENPDGSITQVTSYGTGSGQNSGSKTPLPKPAQTQSTKPQKQPLPRNK